MNDLAELKNKFITGEILTSTINGAFGRNKIYKKDADSNKKIEFNHFLRDLLIKAGNEYQVAITCEKHLANINLIKNESIKKFKDILENDSLTLGTSQKLLNLYLKYLWTLNRIPAPPHCPLDSKIINMLPRINNVENRWTKIDSENDYMYYINEIEKLADGDTIANWELTNWGRN